VILLAGLLVASSLLLLTSAQFRALMRHSVEFAWSRWSGMNRQRRSSRGGP
jgi:hypothetical protein